MNIKQLGPKKDSRYNQGSINPKSCKKLFESTRNEPIIYRSSWEKKFIYWCESSPNVEKWGSECISIRYYNPLDEKEHNYYPDFVVKLKSGETLIVEIKPYNQTIKPCAENSWAMKTYIRNASKWHALEAICKQKGYKFCILTEKTINKL